MDSAKPLYEIIGSNGNTTVRIRRRSDASLQPSSIISIPRYISNIVSCIIYKPFWITWESGRIMIGLGNIINEFVTSALMDQNPFEVKSFGVSTLTDIVGHWKISLPGKKTILNIHLQIKLLFLINIYKRIKTDSYMH